MKARDYYFQAAARGSSDANYALAFFLEPVKSILV